MTAYVPAPRAPEPARPATLRTATLLMPVGPGLGPHDVVAAIDVLVRTAPETLDLDLVIAARDASEDTRAALSAMSGDLQIVAGSISDAAANCRNEIVVVVWAADRPDLADLATHLDRLDRTDDPLPFVHRLGLLVCRRDELAALAAPAVTSDLVDLARQLRPEPVAPPLQPTVTPADVTTTAQAGFTSVLVSADAPLHVLDSCLARLRQHTRSDEAEIVVVDPGGDYERSKTLRATRWLHVVPGSGAHHVLAGLREASGEFVVMLDPGTWVTRRWLDGLLEPLRSSSDVLASGPRTNMALGSQQQPGVEYRDVDAMDAFAHQLRRDAGTQTTDVPALSGCCIAMRRQTLVDAGGLDESFTAELAVLDLCLRLRATFPDGRLVRVDGTFVHVAEPPRGTEHGRWRLGGGGELGQLRARHGADADRALPGLVGAVMIVKDEEEKLARALESVSGIVDDVVVADTGSADGTPRLIDALGARRTTFEWCDDFAAARNAALAAYTGTWALLLDADETLSTSSAPSWRRWLADNPADVVFLVCHNLDSGTGGASVDNASARLLRPERCHWQGRVHEQMVRRDGRPTVHSGTDEARIVHDGYTLRRIVDRGKVDRNAHLSQLSLEDSPEQETGRALFESGRAAVLAGQTDEAERLFRAALQELPAHSELLRRIAQCNLATIATTRGQWDEALEFAREALGDGFGYTQAAYALAVAHAQRGERRVAREVLEQALADGQKLADPSIVQLVLSLRDEGLLFGDLPHMLGALLLEEGEPQRAVDVLRPLARSRPDLFGGWRVLAAALQALEPGLGWVDEIAETVAGTPRAIEPLLHQLSDDERQALLAALERHGVADHDVEADRLWQEMQPELRRMSREGLIAAARTHELSAPALALRLWEFAGDEPRTRIGRARCLDALGRRDDAADLVTGLDPAELDTPDRLYVAALAAGFGDLPLAARLLADLPDDLDPALAAPARQLRQSLATHV